MKSLFMALLLLAALLLVGCTGTADQYSRQRLSADQLTWERELKQLPWRDPALGDNHRPRGGSVNQYLPGRPITGGSMGQYRHIDQRTRAGRHTLPGAPEVRR